MALVWWFVLLGVVLLLVLDWAFVRAAYELPDRPQRIDVTTRDGWTVAAWFRPASQRRYGLPVVLCHGLANNHAFMEFRGEQNLAKFLSELGFDCYSVDLRGVGGTSAPNEGPYDVSFDDHVQEDLPALVDAICAHAGSEQVVWVGHSLGGLVALAAASTSLKGRIAALVTMGSPVFFRFPRALVWLIKLARSAAVWGRFETRMLGLIVPLVGRTPAPRIAHATANLDNLSGDDQRLLVANVFAPMWKSVLGQLQDWIAHDVFRSRDRSVDYREGVRALSIPVLVIGGTVDHLAPPEASCRYFDLLTSSKKQLALFGREHGHASDYGHGDLVVGRRARDEVYPVVKQFLEESVRPGVG
ncbi:MAG: alpha/beta hydrolase [Myxococcaceae bacterium]